MRIGVGNDINFEKYLVVLQHPDTDDFASSEKQIKETLFAISRSPCKQFGFGQKLMPVQTYFLKS